VKWKYETRAQYKERVSKWHKWFAWHPVSWNGVTYWLETIECKVYIFWGFGVDDVWEYREINKESGDE